jgi:polyphosphate kinase
MPRNFFRRVEVLFPVADPALRRWVVGELLATELKDNENASVLRANGAYLPAPRRKGERPLSAHAHFMEDAMRRALRPDHPGQ